MTLFFAKTKSILVLVAILFVGSLGAQDLKNLKINQLSDQQMMQVWQQFSAKGMTESEAMKMMVQKGLGPNEVGMFKKRLVGIQAAQKSKFGTSAASKNFIKDTSMFLQDSSWVSEVPSIRVNDKFYGYSFFSNPNTEFQPNLNMATPKNYILGPGDELNITLSGLNETDIDAKLSRDGSIKVEYVGVISLTGLTIEQAKQRIFARMAKSYPALTMGKTKLNLSLSNGRSIRVTVIGEVERPGAYQVSALATVFNVVYITGGPTLNGSLRNIQVIRNNKMVATIDLYPFLQKGILPADLRLEDQDVLVFTPALKRVEFAGMVKRPMVYELLPNENLAQALAFAGGFSDSAFTDRLKIVQLNGREKLYKDVETSSFMNYIPMQSDSIFAEKMEPLFENKVTITGAVYRPGEYGYTPQLSLKNLLKKADGLRADAFLTRAIIKRVGVNREKTIVSVDLNTLSTTDIALSSEDSIHVFAKDDLIEQQYVTIDGNVRNPGKILFRKGMQIQDLIALAGGFLNDAAYHRVELSRLEKNRTDAMSNQMVDLMKLELDAALTNKDASLTLEPQDYIYVPRLLNYKFIGDVKVRGEVLFPGNFALERRDENIQDIITRAGGLTQYGSLKDLQVFRNGTRIGVNLEQNAAKDMALLLLPGDSLFVSRNDPYVEIVGAVYNPQLIRFESSSFKSYISAAGGLKNRGSLSKAYIQYSNGINRKTTKFLFFRFYPTVKSGSKIIIPDVPEKQKGLTIAEITAITSIISGLVSLAAILKL
jgi:protein involved in polysaccharide export with SLBB domain